MWQAKLTTCPLAEWVNLTPWQAALFASSGIVDVRLYGTDGEA